MTEFSPDIRQRIQNAKMLLIGGSAGSFTPLRLIIETLPADFPIPVVLLVHRGKKFPEMLEGLLREKANVKIKEAEDKENPKGGTVYIAPADYHLLVDWDGSFSLDVAEPVWYCRPSIDVLFESVADSLPGKSIAILLSGANADGVNGMAQIRQGGGVTLVQSPEEAEFPVMPMGAVKRNAADALFLSREIQETLLVIYNYLKAGK